MDFQNLSERINLRDADVLGYILPGSITLAGFYLIAQAIGVARLGKTIPVLFDLDPISSAVIFLAISFLIGHVWDMTYRLLYQKRRWYQREETVKRLLVGNITHSIGNHPASEIRDAMGSFLRIDWAKTPIDQWVDMGKAYEASVYLAYWIEEEDPKLFAAEIGRPILQSHLLHVSGMAFVFVGIFCVPIVVLMHYLGINPSYEYDPLILFLLGVTAYIFGVLLIGQGRHKRDVILEHVFRVFYVIWRKRVLENNPEDTPKKPATRRK